MNQLKNIGALFLLLLFLVGSNGISFFHHFCSGSNTTSTLVYPGVFQVPATCCDDEITAFASIENSTAANLDSTPCCKSSLVYYRLLVNSTPAIREIISLPSCAIPFLAKIDQLFPSETNITNSNVFFEFYSPPLYGRSLINFLHQIKIPLPVSFA